MKIVATGAAIPEQAEDNRMLERRLGLEDGWVERRTGVRQRPTAAPGEATSDFAIRAAENALTTAGIDRRQIGLLVLATSTPDHLLPPTAPLVAHRLGLIAGAVDLTGACAGFLYALVLADGWVNAMNRPALVIGANVLSRRVNPDDATTAALFGDGAGAVVLAPSATPHLLGSFLISDGAFYHTLGIPAGGTREPFSAAAAAERRHLMRMPDGGLVFRHAIRGMCRAGREALKSAGLDAGAVDWWIPHQANIRIIRDAGEILGIPPERTVCVIDRYANTSAASIPIALAHASAEGRLGGGDILLLTAAGAGFISAGVVLRWQDGG